MSIVINSVILQSGETWQECLYHRDWNWLMEAVEFIAKKNNVIISNNHCEVHMYRSGEKPINIGAVTTKEAVSDFAKLYNEGKL
jgi:hypothetical protein